jgi:xylulokinase
VPLVIGVDCSTQSTKVEVRDADSGGLVARARSGHPPTTPPRSEQDPQLWWGALTSAVTEAVGRRSLASSVAAMSVAGQQHGLVALDSQRRVLRPAKLWNDTESSADAERLLGHLEGGRQAWAIACGSVPTAAFTITKLAWLRREEPDAFAALAHVVLPHDWITAMLCGELVTDRGDASGTGYWSPTDDAWAPELLALVDADMPWADMLPKVLGPGQPAGTMHPSVAKTLGLDDGVVVGAGTGDNMAAALRLAMGAGDVAFSIGTSGTVYAVSNVATADPTGAVAGFASATGSFLPLVCTLNAAKVTDAVARLLGVEHSTLSDTALAAPPGAGGAVMIPYLDGERTPNRPSATGSIVGLRSELTRAQVARAAFEGVTCALLDGFDALVAALAAAGEGAAGRDAPPEGRTLLIGGGARAAAYQRCLADLSGRPLEVPDAAELVAAGACVQAAAALRGVDPSTVAKEWGPGSFLEVDPDTTVDAGSIRARYSEEASRPTRDER